jgi:hypothetical protein
MPSLRKQTHLLAAAAAVSYTVAAAHAGAVLCADLHLPNPIYGVGGSAVTATLKSVARAFAGLNPVPVTILYSDPNACTGFRQFVDNKIIGNFRYWDASGVEAQCEPPPAGQPADFSHMGNPAADCTGVTVPADVKDFLAPVQTLNIIANTQSSESSISAEALAVIYGRGATRGVTPWVNEAAIFRRQPTSFVQIFLGSAIGLAPESFLGAENTTNGGVATAVHNSTSPLAAIGFVSGSTADANRSGANAVRTLAYQHTGQTCGFWPDSKENTLDKINVRTGQYYLWASGHFFARVDASGNALNPNVRNLIGWFEGTIESPAGSNVLRTVSLAGDIPQCAMQVKRDGLLGAIRSEPVSAPLVPCGCFFESVVGTTACTACANDTQCAGNTPKCRYNFCEAY